MKQRILIVTALWGRPEISSVVLGYYAELAKRPDMNLQLLCVGSDVQAEAMAGQYGWAYCAAPNEPLTQKFNALYEDAKNFTFDLLVLVGSDDLISPEVFHFYDRTVNRTTPHLVGLSDLYFYSVHEDKTIYFPGYGAPSPKTIGAGRCFSRLILERMSFRPWKGERMNRGLDSVSSANMQRIGIGEVAYKMQETGGIGVDIKGALSLTPFDRLTRRGVLAHNDIVERAFPEQMEAFRMIGKEVAA